MPFWRPGQSESQHCGALLRQDDEVITISNISLPSWEPMSNFREDVIHLSRSIVWPFRAGFVARVNSADAGCLMRDGGSWIFTGQA